MVKRDKIIIISILIIFIVLFSKPVHSQLLKKVDSNSVSLKLKNPKENKFSFDVHTAISFANGPRLGARIYFDRLSFEFAYGYSIKLFGAVEEYEYTAGINSYLFEKSSFILGLLSGYTVRPKSNHGSIIISPNIGFLFLEQSLAPFFRAGIFIDSKENVVHPNLDLGIGFRFP